MRLESRDLISRTTEGSARRLVLVCSGVLVFKIYELQIKGQVYFEPPVTERALAQVMGATIVFLAISHVVHWTADYVLYTNWFRTARVSRLEIFKQGSLNETEPTIVSVLKRLHSLPDSFASVTGYIVSQGAELERIKDRQHDDEAVIRKLGEGIKGLQERFESLEVALSDIVEFAGQLDPGFRKANTLSKLVIFGWFLAVPLLVAALAFLSLLPFTDDFLVSLRSFLGVEIAACQI